MAASDRDILSKIQVIASIASAVAIPLVIALVGWLIQAKIANQTAQKDYVSMAVGILTNPKNQGNDELRTWAVAVLDKTSPIPFSRGLRQKLASGEIVITRPVIVRTPFVPEPPAELMKPPLPLVPLPTSGKVTNGDLVNNMLENNNRFKLNAADQKILQHWIRETSDGANGKPTATPAQSTSSSSNGT
ncbi:hypothetical protein LRK24_17780 [Rhodanobacter denitrificans]|uniref:hypothetical protein n=1 Tax=Rhodanobacter denitrificans TaxID=666685 RepID=UPI0012FE4468|nr:hypothetical protein [Rhodanobacter denitrificans]UJM90251.1 hypothetical protein LRK24_17780 [Rhodanobacter denitrificans]